MALSPDVAPHPAPADTGPSPFPVNDDPTVNALGVRVSALDPAATAARIVRWATEDAPAGGPRYVSATSVHGVVQASRDPAFRAILNRAAIVTPDGMPLVWLGRVQGRRGMSRVYGPDLMKRVCALTAGTAVRHYLYGGAAGVPEELARRLGAAFPGLRVVGAYSPPFRPLTNGEWRSVSDAINASAADIVWVGLSTPKQERWIDAARSLLRCKVVLSVGAAFDFHSGRVRQAPRWMQQSGLEWLFRVASEPGRLWRRYAYNNPRFLWLAFLQVTGLKAFPVSED